MLCISSYKKNYTRRKIVHLLKFRTLFDWKNNKKVFSSLMSLCTFLEQRWKQMMGFNEAFKNENILHLRVRNLKNIYRNNFPIVFFEELQHCKLLVLHLSSVQAHVLHKITFFRILSQDVRLGIFLNEMTLSTVN